MTDIVTRLRNLGYLGWPTCYEAADEIERLRAAVRDAHGLIDNDLVIPWIIAHKLDDVLGIHKPQTQEGIDDAELDGCPECGARLVTLWSGVKCSKCPYWFCY